MKILHIVLIFLIIGAFVISTSYNLNLKKSADRRSFMGKFAIWSVNVGKNVIRTAGYALKLDWLPERPENITNTTTNYTIED